MSENGRVISVLTASPRSPVKPATIYPSRQHTANCRCVRYLSAYMLGGDRALCTCRRRSLYRYVVMSDSEYRSRERLINVALRSSGAATSQIAIIIGEGVFRMFPRLFLLKNDSRQATRNMECGSIPTGTPEDCTRSATHSPVERSRIPAWRTMQE